MIRHQIRSSVDEEVVLPSLERVSQKTFLGIAWAATAITLLFLVFRLTIRLRSFRKLFSDDYLVIAAWLMLFTSTIIWQIKLHLLYWQYDVTFGRAPPSEDFVAAYATFLPQIVTFSVLFYSCLWAVKFSFLMFFRRLGSEIKAHKIWWRVVFVLTLAGWIASIADFDYRCAAGGITYVMTECTLANHVKFQRRTFYSNMVADIVTDLLVLSTPVLILWNVQIPTRKKLILFAIFSVTVFIMVVSIIRVTMVVDLRGELRNASIDWLYTWSNVEMAVAIIVACVASFRQLFVSSQRAGNLEQSGSRSRRGVFWYLGFNRLSAKKTSNDDSHHHWPDANLDPKIHGSMDAGSQTYMVPLEHVHVKNTVDVHSDVAAPNSLKMVNGQQQRGYEFV
ncbi:hypothetical protein F5B20DRAFT_585879 [Whalleya microplaca]|nr:hypothetical protein F5B20DRAFT_585879 [Whalleya microplaca]